MDPLKTYATTMLILIILAIILTVIAMIFIFKAIKKSNKKREAIKERELAIAEKQAGIGTGNADYTKQLEIENAVLKDRLERYEQV